MSSPAAISPDVITILTNAVIGLAAIGAAAGGIFVGLRKIRTGVNDTADQKKLVGVSLIENTTLLMWSESNRDVADALRDLIREMIEHRHMMDKLKDKL